MRRIAFVVVACTPLLLSGCQGSVVESPVVSSTKVIEPSTTPLATATPEPTTSSSQTSSPTPIAPPSTEPSASAETAGFAFNDILQVEVNGLAVRTAPYEHMPLATGWTTVAGALVELGDVRLTAGDFVSVDLGPLHIGDTTWYRVWPAEDAQLHYSTVSWDTKNNGANPVEPGWVAAAVGADVYLTLHDPFEPEPWLSGLPLLVAGTGRYVSEPLENHDLFVLEWVYLIDDQLAPCDLTMTLEPASGGPGVAVVDHSTIGAYEEGRQILGTANRVPIVGETFDPFRLRVESGCEWALRLEPLPHD